MAQRGDPGWDYIMGSRLVAAVVFVVAGVAIILTDPRSVWVGVALLGLGSFVLAMLYVAYRRGKY